MTLMMQSFFNRRPVVTTTFAALGGIWAAYKLKSLLDFSYLHFLHRSSLDRYKASKSHDPTTEAWALVTGASDGIGRGFSEELLARGFNVILHGRNEKKLNDVKSELSKQWPDRQIRIFVFDATGDIRELELAVQQLAGLNIQVLINNIGAGQRPFWVPLAENTAKRIGLSVDVDARFPTEITRILLPELVKNSPSLIINIGSLASESPVPYASVLSGTKAYNKAWSRSLGLEMMAEGHDIEVLHILVGMVATPYEGRKISFMVPGPRRMASDSLNKVGCGKDVVVGYWPHTLQYLVMTDLPALVCRRMILSIIKGEREKEQRMLKSQ